MKILAIPRDSNPYQGSLYDALGRRGHVVRYAGTLTKSHTVNLIALPVELAFARLAGYRVLHVHWVFGFSLPLIGHFPKVRRAMRAWFSFFLATARLLGLRVVWVAHNVLPHQQIFDDDVAGRRRLLTAADAVVVHDRSVLRALTTIGSLPAQQHVGRLPAYEVEVVTQRERLPGPLRVLFFGLILSYKGVEDLVAAACGLTEKVQIRIVGECRSPQLRGRLDDQVARAGAVVSLKLRRLTDSELEAELEAADVVALPFRQVTTSSSVVHALSAGLPVLIPALAALESFPDDAVVRYNPRADPVVALRVALDGLAASPADLRNRGAAAREWAVSYTWDDLAGEVERASRDLRP